VPEVDPAQALVRNRKVTDRARQLPAQTAMPDATAAPAGPVMIDVVVLSGDLPLYEAIRNSVGERNPVWRARSAEESVDLLLSGRCGVLLIDMAAVSTNPATLVEQVVDQFPDVVVVVAGRREDESALAGLISDGLVYRFMHKPLSPKRAGMFLNAAMRSHVQRREGRAEERLMPLTRELRSRVDPRKWLFVGAGVALFLVLLAAVLAAHFGRHQDAGGAGTASAPPLHSALPLADPVLSRARAALAAGRYAAPAGRNALDLYAAVLLTSPDNVEARQGLATTIARLLEDAERAIADGDTAEARRIAERVLQVDAGNAGARSVIAGLAPKSPPVAAPPVVPRSAAAPVMANLPPATAAAAKPVSREDEVAARVPAQGQLPAPVAAASSQAVAQPPIVRPDPLAPRVVGGGTLPTLPGAPKPRVTPRRFEGPVVPSLPIAGYAKRPPEGATPAPTVTDGTPSVSQRDLEPVATPDPAYPPDAFREGVEGWVEVEFTVTERGTTGDVQVVASEPRGVFDAAAVQAVAAWTYRPRLVYGRPVAQRSSVTLRFTIDD